MSGSIVRAWGALIWAVIIHSMHVCHVSSRAVWVQVGRRLAKVSMLSGSIVRVWGALEGVLVRSESILSKSDRLLKAGPMHVCKGTGKGISQCKTLLVRLCPRLHSYT